MPYDVEILKFLVTSGTQDLSCGEESELVV